MTGQIEEFPFVAEMPKRAKSKLATRWEVFERMQAIVEVEGLLVPPVLAGKLLGVSKQRVDELMKVGRLKRVDWEGHPFVTENSLHEYARSERKGGRPPKVRTVAQVVKLAVQMTRPGPQKG